MIKPAKPDTFFIQLNAVLILLGIAFVISASWSESIKFTGSAWTLILKQLVTILLGVAIMWIVSYVHYKWWQKTAWIYAGLCLILLLLTAKYGLVIGGSRRWLDVGLLNLQVSEFAKIASVALMAKVLAEGNKHFWQGLLLALGMAALVLKQPDLGTTILIGSGVAFTLFAAQFNLLLFFSGIAALGSAAWWHIQRTPYQMDRIKYWIDPYSDPLGHGYNLIQAQHAIGHGGIWGVGFGSSIQKLGALPIAHADFIFAVICEEIGLLGAAVVLSIFLAWALKALDLSFKCPDKFGQLLGVGLTGVFILQVLINIAVATGLFPITGMTLPFVSFGGSSFLSVSVLAGILLNVSREQAGLEDSQL